MIDPAPTNAEPIVADPARQPCLRRVASADPGCWALFARLLLWATRNAEKETPRPNGNIPSA